jgi:AbrB family looped-hinge helix DNA binding protein
MLSGKTRKDGKMALVTLSSKGQLVLPKEIRDALGLTPGTTLRITSKGRKILLEPVTTSMIERLYGKFSGEKLLTDLETDHRQEILREDRS